MEGARSLPWISGELSGVIFFPQDSSALESSGQPRGLSNPPDGYWLATVSSGLSIAIRVILEGQKGVTAPGWPLPHGSAFFHSLTPGTFFTALRPLALCPNATSS